ncbi:ABC-type polysaccharide/polyol phosphate export systems, permease component [Pelotomaculum thermopropionicum SI]|uniref:Transport permease protein n=1 Tax=Pelotomaculum thermopropionicum (strain DSM 13744 / JCM 10971 / SI) TaxID=370438 RepID=A5CZ10_PELTS|nr:ABC-type polysaccharide/polyol phosphate export systems, permease component [Pelotomaculum thermopropionicum SI]
MFEFAKEIFYNRYVIWSLVMNDLKNRYRRSFLGFAWSFVSPLAMVIIIGFVFSEVLGQPIEEFVPYLFAGLNPWIFITTCADAGAISFISAEGYIKQSNIPLIVFPLRVALGGFINLIFALAAFIVLIIIFQNERLAIGTFAVIPGLLALFIVGFSFAIISGIAHTNIRDYSHIQSLVLQAVFYATPIMFPSKMLGKKLAWLYKYNPIYHILETIRIPILEHKFPNPESWLWTALFSLFMLLSSLLFLKKTKRVLVFKI